ncbi:cytochrome c maturation protein CcmE [Azospirillum palustre]
MRKPAAFALLAGLASGTVFGLGTALADQTSHSAQASAPQPIADVLNAGGGTVVGSVTAAGSNWLTVSDESAQTNVTVRDALPEGIHQGDPITIVGRVRHGGLMASEIILADGTWYGSIAQTAERSTRDSDGDDD